ncbi:MULTISPECIES: hypothetical protein [Bradyrhizobium]|uniref:hypothetical protein n=1 Tax=Bradyrhizobium TaxID=374 RepID=UPI0004075E3F|nr:MULTISPECIES: hypothetical protein [Bradyrhizobium]QOG20621.1 hypothetical protein FOM02_27995 [Bradyrhizobium sp. SEMIA]UFW46034.1 hypothetical protein BaraCB756_27390 [Bradyrhizobium arachidis]
MIAAADARLRSLAGKPAALQGHRLVASATVLRLTFFVGYYALNVLFAADKFVAALTFPSFLICCYNILRIRRSCASVEDMLWLLMYVFFVIAPCQTLRFGHFENEGPVTGFFFTNGEIAMAFVVVFVFLLTATVTRVLVRRLVSASEPVRYRLKDNALPVLLVLCVLGFAMFVVAQGGMGNVLADRYSKELSDNGAMGTAGASALALQMVACLLICVHAKFMPYRQNARPVVVAISTSLALAMLFIAQNPYNTARFYFLMAWLPIVLVFISGRLGIKTFYLGVLVGLVVLMPMLNLTSRSGASLAEAVEAVDFSSVLTIPGLDVLDMLVYEVRYLELSDFFWGTKTLGLVLFFVPRSLWPGKETILASDMGLVLADLGTAGTPNLSGFVAGDFYADLGIVGVAIGALFVSFLLTFFGIKRAVLVHGLDLRAFVFMASAPILVRGSLGSVVGLTFVEMIILAVLTRVMCRRS